jgi:hypothetical protein
MTSSHSTPAPCQWFSRLAIALGRRSAPRLALLFLGAVLQRFTRVLHTEELVPTVSVGMPSSTLRIAIRAAERPGRHSHGGPWERGRMPLQGLG